MNTPQKNDAYEAVIHTPSQCYDVHLVLVVQSTSTPRVNDSYKGIIHTLSLSFDAVL